MSHFNCVKMILPQIKSLQKCTKSDNSVSEEHA